MLTKEITAYGKSLVIGCDGKCDKAFGLNGRPSVQVGTLEDDYAWLADDEVGIAPPSGKTKTVSEGFDQKPHPDYPETLLNKWCFRECERCVQATTKEELALRDFTNRLYNMKQEVK